MDSISCYLWTVLSYLDHRYIIRNMFDSVRDEMTLDLDLREYWISSLCLEKIKPRANCDRYRISLRLISMLSLSLGINEKLFKHLIICYHLYRSPVGENAKNTLDYMCRMWKTNQRLCSFRLRTQFVLRVFIGSSDEENRTQWSSLSEVSVKSRQLDQKNQRWFRWSYLTRSRWSNSCESGLV